MLLLWFDKFTSGRLGVRIVQVCEMYANSIRYIYYFIFCQLEFVKLCSKLQGINVSDIHNGNRKKTACHQR